MAAIAPSAARCTRAAGELDEEMSGQMEMFGA